MNIDGVNNESPKDVEINLSNIDWNKLSPEEFKKVNETLLEKQKLVKSQERKQQKTLGNIVVKLRGNCYEIKRIDYERLKTLKSQKSKDKLIDKLIDKNKPIKSI
jgi:hypothetical protein|nr:MAG TPA: hypothetical protein [Caudoviricetes sp.]